MCFRRNKKNYTINEKKETLVVYKELPKKELKLNYNLIVPENYICYIFTKEKLTDSFCSGEVKLYALTMPSTCEIHRLDKPTRKGFKKRVKADLLFVNLKNFSLKNSIKIKKEKEKTNLSYSINYKVKDAKKFLEFLLSERAFFKNDYAEKQLDFYLSYLLFYYYMDYDFDVEKFKKYIENKMSKIGIEVLQFELEGEFKEKINETTESKKELVNEKVKKLENFRSENNVVTANNFGNITNEELPKKLVEFFTCECGAILPKNAKSCFKCQRKFEDDNRNLCENCGLEIGENVHVCPHCHSVLF